MRNYQILVIQGLILNLIKYLEGEENDKARQFGVASK